MTNCYSTGYKERVCPFCGGNDLEKIGSVQVSSFCDVNFAYRPEGYKQLGFSGDELFPIVECSNCHVGAFSLCELSGETLRRVYDWLIVESISKTYSLREDRLARNARVCDHFLNLRKQFWQKEGKTLRMLDYGAGWGDFSVVAKKRGFDVLAYEMSSSRTEHLKELKIDVCNNKDLLLTQGPYDLVYCNQVLEHVPNPSEVLELLRKVLGKNGVLFVTVPACEKGALTQLLQAEDSNRPKEINPWEHMNYFYRDQFEYYLEKHNFKKIEGCSSFYR